MRTALSLILLVSEMLMVRRTKVEAYVLKKLVFVSNNFVEDVIGNFPRTVQNFPK